MEPRPHCLPLHRAIAWPAARLPGRDSRNDKGPCPWPRHRQRFAPLGLGQIHALWDHGKRLASLVHAIPHPHVEDGSRLGGIPDAGVQWTMNERPTWSEHHSKRVGRIDSSCAVWFDDAIAMPCPALCPALCPTLPLSGHAMFHPRERYVSISPPPFVILPFQPSLRPSDPHTRHSSSRSFLLT